MYGFCLENAMGYGISESMGYGLEFPAYRHGSSKILWGMREYGLSGVWVIRVLTVCHINNMFAQLSVSSECLKVFK